LGSAAESSVPERREVNRIELIVPWDPHRTSDNSLRRKHWSVRSGEFKTAKTLARLMWARADWPKAAKKVRASFVIRRGRQMDPANVIGGLKPVIDGLFVCGITPDDNSRWLQIGSVTIETGKQWRDRPEIVVTVEEVE
jgi:hypothetical protein